MSQYPEALRDSESEELRGRIDQLERELDRHRSQERLMAETLLSATRHAAAIRESARREAELTLRKARVEAERLTARAVRERDDALQELMRLRRITERMRNGLSSFLTAEVEELGLDLREGEAAEQEEQEEELGTALGDAVEARSATGLRTESEVRSEVASQARPDVLDRGGYDSTGGSPPGLP